MHQLKFYPVGNGDASQIILENGRRLIFDFRHTAEGENGEKPHIDLKTTLADELAEANKKSVDVLAFTHGDDDHIAGSTEFFELEHAAKYQGEDRIPVDELWVPAGMILEEAPVEDSDKEYVIWRQEARHRLINGQGIQVFSRPDKLKGWLESKGLTLEDREHLITDAGQLANGFSLPADGVEFFCHSPFIKHTDEGDNLRNNCALIFQVRFEVDRTVTDYWAVGDTSSETLSEIVSITKYHNNEDRLAWDIFNIPHHCSYLCLSDEKGDHETTPTPEIAELLRSGRENAYMVSSSHPIRSDEEAHQQTQPPHIQAKRCYENHLGYIGGRDFLVTMEEPSEREPEPIIFEIGGGGHSLRSAAMTGAATIITSNSPRAGCD